MKIKLIRTKRFIVRKLDLKDVSQDYLNWFKKENNLRYIENKPKNISDLHDYVKKNIEDNSVVFLGIFDIYEKKHIGNIKFEKIDLINKKGVVGFLIGDPLYRGKGVITEVFFEIINQLKLHINYLYLGVDINNKSAISLYKKLGFFEKNRIDIIDSSKDNILIMELKI